jgi:hypothetical protein
MHFQGNLCNIFLPRRPQQRPLNTQSFSVKTHFIAYKDHHYHSICFGQHSISKWTHTLTLNDAILGFDWKMTYFCVHFSFIHNMSWMFHRKMKCFLWLFCQMLILKFNSRVPFHMKKRLTTSIVYYYS